MKKKCRGGEESKGTYKKCIEFHQSQSGASGTALLCILDAFEWILCPLYLKYDKYDAKLVAKLNLSLLSVFRSPQWE